MDVTKITALFGVYSVVGLEKINSGHINETYLVESRSGLYVLQSLNKDIFKKPEIVMRNISLIEEAFSVEKRVFVPRFMTCNGKNYAKFEGRYWRMYEFIQSWERYPNKEYIHGFAVGTFQRIVNSHEFKFKNPIPWLHDLSELEVLKSVIPVRNIHGDAKADNILYGDRPTIIDLDTAMSGFAAFDYGDMIRSITTDKIDLNKIENATRGYADGLDGFLTGAEINSLYFGIILVIRELYKRYSNEAYSFPNKSAAECTRRANELITQLGYIRKNEDKIVKIINRIFC